MTAITMSELGFANPTIAKQLRNVAATARVKAAKATSKPAAAPAKPAPKAKAKASKPAAAPVLALTDKGSKFNPVPSQSRVKGDANAQAWAAIKAACPADRKTLQALVPTNRGFVSYAVRQGWLATS